MTQEKNGWIKLHRKLQDNPIIMKDAEHLAVWIYLLMNATHTEYSALFKGEKIVLKPGQLITGRKSIAVKLSISESKVARILKSFENEQQIEQQTSNKNRLISIKNWNSYQSNEQQTEQQLNNNRTTTEQQLNNNRTTTEQQLNTNKNVNNDKNVNNKISNICDSDESAPPPKVAKHKYGEYKNVLLTDDELQKLKTEYSDWEERIERLSSYVASTGKRYKSHYVTIRHWAKRDEKDATKDVPTYKKSSFHQFEQRNYDFDALEKTLVENISINGQ